MINALAEEDTNETSVKSVLNQSEVQEFMQFNLKKSKNYSIPLHIVNRLEEFSSREVEYTGAVPLMRYRGEVMPLLFIERQLELCSIDECLIDFYPELLKVIVVDLHNKQYGIVVDEILDIGTTDAQLDTRNTDREGFIGTIFIGDKTATIVDIHFLIHNYINFEKELIKDDEQEVYFNNNVSRSKAA